MCLLFVAYRVVKWFDGIKIKEFKGRCRGNIERFLFRVWREILDLLVLNLEFVLFYCVVLVFG